MHEYFNLVYYQHYYEIIYQLLNTCIILVGGRSDLFNSGGELVERGGGYFQNSGASWLKGGGGQRYFRPCTP